MKSGIWRVNTGEDFSSSAFIPICPSVLQTELEHRKADMPIHTASHVTEKPTAEEGGSGQLRVVTWPQLNEMSNGDCV